MRTRGVVAARLAWGFGACPEIALGITLGLVLGLVQPVAAESSSATPQELPLSQLITLEPGASCLEHTRLIAHVKMWLGADHASAALRVHVHGDALKPRALRFEIIQSGQTRQRVFDPSPESCDDAHAVMGLAIALAIDAERLQRTLFGDDLPRERRLRLVALQLVGSVDVLPDTALGVQAGVQLGIASWLDVRGDLFAHTSWNDHIAGSRGSFDASLFAGSVALCAGGFADTKLRLSLCSGLAAGALLASGHGYAPNHSATGFWLAARSGARLDLDLGLHLLLDIDVISAIYTPAFESERTSGDQLVRKPSSTGFALSLGPALAF